MPAEDDSPRGSFVQSFSPRRPSPSLTCHFWCRLSTIDVDRCRVSGSSRSTTACNQSWLTESSPIGDSRRSLVINARLPFESPQFAGGALFVVVGLPMVTAAFAAWRGSRRDDLWAASAGALLMGWIVVEIGVIQSFSWLQPTLFAFGAAIAFAGYRHWHLTWGSKTIRRSSPTCRGMRSTFQVSSREPVRSVSMPRPRQSAPPFAHGCQCRSDGNRPRVSRFGDRLTNHRVVGGGCEEMIAL
jgi:hypothetical protein